MERRAYEAVVLSVLLLLVCSLSLWRYQRSRRAFHLVETLVLTGQVAVAANAPARPPKRNINTVTIEELDALPDIPRKIADAIVARRQQQPFATLADLAAIDGIGARRLQTLAEALSCGPAALPTNTTAPKAGQAASLSNVEQSAGFEKGNDK